MKPGRPSDPLTTEISSTLGIGRSWAIKHGPAYRKQFLQMSDDAKRVLANSGNKKPVRSAPAITEKGKAQK